MGGVGEKNTKKAFTYFAVFSVGTAVTFVALGIIATSAGKLMGTSSPVWYMVLGVLMLLYSIGHSALVMVAGTSIGFVQKVGSSEKI